MKTIKEVNAILSKCKHVDSHVHTHLCDGAKDMTIENIAARAKKCGIDGIILTPHFHKRVSDGETSLYTDSDPAIFSMLREEISYYERTDGAVSFILSTEADIISADGDLSLPASEEAMKSLDIVTPTLNYHPSLPLAFIGLTMGAHIDHLHESGAYAAAAEKIGGIAEVLSSAYDIQSRAISRCPYPAMLGHLFMAHSFHPHKNNCFGARAEHLPLMKEGVSRLIAACQKANALIDLTGVHLGSSKTISEKLKHNDFLVDFQKYVIKECEKHGLPAYYGSDAHNLDNLGDCTAYYEALYHET